MRIVGTKKDIVNRNIIIIGKSDKHIVSGLSFTAFISAD